MATDITENYLSAIGLEHRKKLGQFFTPAAVAKFMCAWALGGNRREIFDPAFGLGAFHFAATELDPEVHFSGSEIDSGILEYLNRNSPGRKNLSVVHEDYLSSWGRTHGSIVCNPPYMRFQHFTNRKKVFSDFRKVLNLKLSGYTNTASAFLLKSLSELPDGGRLAYIMPFEFLNTGYGEIVKRELLKSRALKTLIRLECEKEAFPDAITSLGIMLAENNGAPDPVKFHSIQRIGDLEQLSEIEPNATIPPDELNPADKWLPYFDKRRETFQSEDLVTISYYGAFSRGIATGANKFFSLNPSKVSELGLPGSALVYCITKSSQIKKAVFEKRDLTALEKKDEHVFLLNANGSLPDPVARYIRYGEENGYHERYLTKKRTPWYKLEKRTPAPILFGVFSRKRFKAIRNYSPALNLTCYHGFHPNLIGSKFLDRLFLYLQSAAARRILKTSMRIYGDGLEKFEPNDLNGAFAPSPQWFKRITQKQSDSALDHCKKTGRIPEKLEAKFGTLIK
ncbi:MAG: N-6 DNA methylase [Planctomycetota bacterium]|jgi:adenine-specific DNA-methyltransferase